MTKSRTFFLITIVAIVFWITRTPEIKTKKVDRPQEPRLETPLLKKKPRSQTPLPQPLPPTVAPPQVSSTKQAPHTAPPNSVPFELINGLVISHGDILIGKPTTEDFPQAGFVQEPDLQLWPTPQIPYSIDPNLPNPDRVLRAIQYFNENSPVQFVPFNGEKDSLVFAPGQELCLSYLGKIGGAQPIYLDDRCAENEIRHEIMHALGFIHEQSRPDRDQFVQVNWDNIEDERQGQFFTIAEKPTSPLKNRPFDYNSVMIYSPTLFTKDRSKPNMISKTGKSIEPTVNALSLEDLERLRALYPNP